MTGGVEGAERVVDGRAVWVLYIKSELILAYFISLSQSNSV